MTVCVSESIEIDAKPEHVWELVIDPRRHTEWVPSLRESRGLPEGELREGDSFEQELCLVGRTMEMQWTLLEREDPKLAVWEATAPGGVRADVRFELTGTGDRTTFHYRNEFEPPGGRFGGFAARAVAVPAKRQARKSLTLLKSAAES